jgi:DegV family protein with EDD domain
VSDRARTVALVTDSNAQLPPSLRDRYRVRVVPVTVLLDAVAYREGVDLTTPEYYLLANKAKRIRTAAPAPGQVLEVYAAAAASGADRILSVHTGANVAATFGTARLAAERSPVPVQLVDTRTAAFAVGACVWAAGDALAAGGDLSQAHRAAVDVAARVGNVFIAGALPLAARGSRFAPPALEGEGLAVLAFDGGRMREVGRVRDADEAVDAMARHVEERAAGGRLRIGVGDGLAGDLADALEGRLRAGPAVEELVRYEIGPSVGAYTGPGTVGAVFF